MSNMVVNPDADESFTQFVRGGQPNLNHVKFYKRFVTNKQGQNGQHVDFIMIISPGQSKSEIHRKVREEDKAEYPQQWAQYQQGAEQREVGTPLEQLPGLIQGMARAANANYVYTIEQMAQASDLSCQNIGMGAIDMRAKARAYLKDLTQREYMLKADLEERDARIAELEARLASLESRPEPAPTESVDDKIAAAVAAALAARAPREGPPKRLPLKGRGRKPKVQPSG